ncbi:N-acetylmannosamine-6-phosphate 2-epimerase [uncultured Synechococcales cyanobacterium]|uniref:Putative N-acetylmannosamine-6-phosphate 2-epimerase n=1 Tax=uncultured Synechococcales cyanobacterium TaxID=1936017 RepID=A0A6J4VRM1_9CYAN|nr:N-acetylmannosamine-6-phosphate 2-epimerase [uncultured Synechococcales cyanobacterium]
MLQPPAPVLQSLKQKLVVSCQAPIDSPLHEPYVIAAIAQAATNQGAAGVRIDTPAHIQAVRQRVSVPIIGLWKQVVPGFEVYITPQIHHAQAIATAGADMIAIDATARPRPGGEALPELIAQIHSELGLPVMADVDTLEAAIAAEAAGADCIGTTLYGYTAETANQSPPGLDLLAQMVQQLKVPAICEGGIASPAIAQEALERGAYAVVVGTDITGIDLKVKAYQSVFTAKSLPAA